MGEVRNLIILTPDKDIQAVIENFLKRIPKTETLTDFTYKVFVHPGRDPSILRKSHEFLRPFIRQYNYCIALLDFAGCGKERTDSPEDIEKLIESNLSINGWEDRCIAVCIEPEIEQWLWAGDVHIRAAVKWSKNISVREWLESKQVDYSEPGKPIEPKTAFELLLRENNIPNSSSIFAEIASKASYKKCRDRSFVKLIEKLREWLK